MWYICRCGRSKSGPPYHSSAAKPWVCSKVCSDNLNRVRDERADPSKRIGRQAREKLNSLLSQVPRKKSN